MLFNVTGVTASVMALASFFKGYIDSRSTSPRPAEDMQLATRAILANGIELRILPLGDSITNGFKSSSNNGYRLHLQRGLAGSNVLFVGSRSVGTMDDNYNEGWDGFTIDQIRDKAILSVGNFRPNIILLHAGTNDFSLIPPTDPAGAPNRLGKLIDDLISFGGKDSVILVAQIIDVTNGEAKSLIQKYNDAIPSMVAKRSIHHIAVVDFRGKLQASDYADNLHPNDSGYKKMADVWFKVIQDVANKGWIKAPQGPRPNHVGPNGLAKQPNSHCATSPIWVPAINSSAGPIASGVGEAGDRVVLADLNGDGLDDYVVLRSNAAVRLYINGGLRSDGKNWSWIRINKFDDIKSGTGAKRDTIHFADLDGDRKQDFNIVDPKSGSIIHYKNGGQQPDGKWSWDLSNNGRPIATGLGPGRNVRLADMDGDGKADYLLLGTERGDAILYLNKGEKPGGWNWVPYDDGKPIATGIGFGADNVQFKDIDGDGFADYLGIDPSSGATTVYRNLGPKPNGGWSWVPMNDAKPIATGIGSAGRNVLWGRLEKTNRYSYVGIDPNTRALRAYLNGCNEFSPPVNSSSGSGAPGGSGNSGGADSGPGSGADASGEPSNPSAGEGSGSGSGSGNSEEGSGKGSGAGSGNGPDIGSPSGSEDESDGDALGVYVNGGEPFPSEGLGGLGLATVGAAATSAMTAYAITAQNDLTTARHAVRGLRSGNPTSAGVSAVVGALARLASDYAALSNQAKKWNINSFDGKARPGAQKTLSGLQSAGQKVSDLIPKLNACALSLGKRQASSNCRPAYNQAATILSGSNMLTPLSWLGSSGRPGGASAGEGGGGGGSGGVSVLGGGLPLPSGGLGGLGLPTAGAQAITALKPYAVTAYNALVSASNLARPLGASPSAGQISAAGSALDAAGSDLAAISTQVEAIELQSLTGGQPAIVQTELANLRNAAGTVSGLSSRLRGAVNTPGFKAAAIVIASIATEQYILQSLYFFLSQDNPLAPGTIPPVLVPPSDDNKPTDWFLNTVPGTSVKTFQEWIKGLPDKGLGRQHIFAGSNYQSYAGTWTKEEAEIINQDPIVDHQVPNVRLMHVWGFFERNSTAITEDGLQKRVDSPTIVTYARSQRHLKILSLFPNTNIADASNTNPLLDYAFEVSAGLGTFVYVFDGGYNWNHAEFQGLPHEQYIVPTLRNVDGTPVRTIDDQNRGHGTSVAAMVFGRTLGVAKRTTVIGVKISGDAGVTPEDTIVGWRWAVEDVRAKNREGKAVFVSTIHFEYPPALRTNDHAEYAYRAPYNIPRPQAPDAFVPALAEAWNTGIVTVFATGNKPNPRGITDLGGSTPQRFGHPRNAIITVASVTRTGAKSDFNIKPGPPSAGPGNPIVDMHLIGEITTYAMADPVILPDIRGNHRYTASTGTSYASPQVGGLAAYLLGLPNIQVPQDFRRIPMAMKNHIVRTTRSGSHGGLGVAYNGVRELPCNPTTILHRSVNDERTVIDKVYGLVGINMTLAKPALSQDEEIWRPANVVAL